MSEPVLVALGSNLGESAALLHQAAVALHPLKASSVYCSEPAYLIEQPSFLNAVVQVDLDRLEPGPASLFQRARFLLHRLQAMEVAAGRASAHPKNGARCLDLDILDVPGLCSKDPELRLPHPLLLERDFVVTPLLEICPAYILADGRPVSPEGVKYGRVTAKLGAL
ncbi:MAG: 2-amino-4-hydroxy-6-hydroxymethyldihydropteridine diphosphokinase [Coriobacteriales bacterium]|nr:2-amino-4-hydroxy-6-hydroxymethyldihydropteridine diphosphokinase [Coriobacteriales bacterium]